VHINHQRGLAQTAAAHAIGLPKLAQIVEVALEHTEDVVEGRKGPAEKQKRIRGQHV